MFSGKTEELLRRLERHRIANRKVALIKPNIDIRKNITHSGKVFNPIVVGKNDWGTVYNILKENDVVGIDEVEFFEESIYKIVKQINQHHMGTEKIIIAAGLDMDYQGNPFGIVPKLLAIADEITKLHAVCESCYGEANISHRLSNKKEQIVIGGKDEYVALCWRCQKDK